MEHIAHDETSFVRPAEVGEMELYHAKTWLGKYVFSQDAKTIAIQYAATAIAIGMVALVLSWFMRLQLAWPNTFTFIDPAYYLQAVTMHGMIMVVYLLTALFLGGFGNYLIPLMVGARDMVFPWLNMISFWVYFTAVLLLAASFFVGGGSTGAGWTLYPPQAILPGTPGSEAGILLMLASLAVFIIGFTMGGLNYVVTILQARTRGMTLMRMPLTIWGIFVATILALFAFPALFVSAIMMSLDVLLGTSFFMPAIMTMGSEAEHVGGNPLLFQHLFWFYSHPAVYIMILPGMGVVSELIPCFSRRPLFGYKAVALSSMAIAVFGFLVWGHHMFVSGQSAYAGIVFSFLSYCVAIPSAIKVFNWSLTLRKGHIRFPAPMLYALGFLGLFTFGGLAGLFVAAIAVDVHLHDTYFVVAHFHYIMVGGMVSAFMGGLHFWWPKMTGRMYPELWGQIAAAMTFTGFNLTFFPQYILGYLGMPRRYHAYPPEFAFWNVLSSAGAVILAAGYLLPLGYLTWSLFRGERAGANPWAASGLEWKTPSPPPPHNFEETPEATGPVYDYPPPEGER